MIRIAARTAVSAGHFDMPPHPVAGCVLEVLVLLVTTLHQSGKCVVVKVVVAALLFPVATSAGILLCEAALSILLPKLGRVRVSLCLG